MTTPKVKIADKSDGFIASEIVKYDAIYYERAKKADSKLQKAYNVL